SPSETQPSYSPTTPGAAASSAAARARSTASAHRRSGVRLRVAALTGIASLLRRLTSAPLKRGGRTERTAGPRRRPRRIVLGRASIHSAGWLRYARYLLASAGPTPTVDLAVPRAAVRLRRCAGQPHRRRVRADGALESAATGHYGVVATARTPRGATGSGGPEGVKARRAGRLRAVGRALHLPFTGAARGIRKATHAHGAG